MLTSNVEIDRLNEVQLRELTAAGLHRAESVPDLSKRDRFVLGWR